MHTFEELQDLFNAHLLKQKFDRKPKELYEPFSYLINLGGKRVRPVLLLMACEAFNGKAGMAFPQAVAIELFHNFTLIHDDIMDHASKRRGKETVHQKFGSAVAILSGDAMLVYAYHNLMKAKPALIPKLINVFNDCAIKVCEGQQLDMNFETSWNVSVSDYLKMIELKTGTLLATALKIGALVAAASNEQANHLYHFGIELGIAFQLKDDLLDTFGEENKTGKKGGGDIIQNKRTFLLLTAMNNGNAKDRKELRKLYSEKTINHTEKVENVISIFRKSDVESTTSAKVNLHFSKAISHLNRVKLQGENKKELLSFSHALLNREH